MLRSAPGRHVRLHPTVTPSNGLGPLAYLSHEGYKVHNAIQTPLQDGPRSSHNRASPERRQGRGGCQRRDAHHLESICAQRATHKPLYALMSLPQMWRNDQPRPINSPTDAILDAGHPLPAHITLTISRRGSAGGDLESAVQPYLTALHVIRTSQPPLTPSAELAPPDAPTSSHFAWAAPPAIAPLSAEVREAAYSGGFFLPGLADGGNSIVLSAWNGPSWGDLRNGVDDMVEYNAVVEFEGGVFLRSSSRRIMIVS
ncbi:hypothetical protein BC834DRAFT_345145 [Gloeopeniophorella convolvens]|nr:hypothetical protein BC834DRAFT_345145 [Gloeopeniophorella convolvens]